MLPGYGTPGRQATRPDAGLARTVRRSFGGETKVAAPQERQPELSAKSAKVGAPS